MAWTACLRCRSSRCAARTSAEPRASPETVSFIPRPRAARLRTAYHAGFGSTVAKRWSVRPAIEEPPRLVRQGDGIRRRFGGGLCGEWCDGRPRPVAFRNGRVVPGRIVAVIPGRRLGFQIFQVRPRDVGRAGRRGQRYRCGIAVKVVVGIVAPPAREAEEDAIADVAPVTMVPAAVAAERPPAAMRPAVSAAAMATRPRGRVRSSEHERAEKDGHAKPEQPTPRRHIPRRAPSALSFNHRALFLTCFFCLVRSRALSAVVQYCGGTSCQPPGQSGTSG